MSSSTVDTSASFHGYAVMEKGGKFVPFSYHPRPLGEHDVEIAISHCGICASDMHTVLGDWGEIPFPMCVGHEIVGTVTKTGPKSQYKQGQRVAVGAQCFSCLDCGRCKQDIENHCPKMVGTYNGKYPDGERSQGGYNTFVRVHEHFVFTVPENLKSEEAAPLLCAGATVYAPLARYGAGKGKRVGIVGIGGLGHIALQFAAKMGAETFAISTSKSKAPDALKFGATAHVNSDDEKEMGALAGKLDLLIMTANAPDMDFNKYTALLGLDGVFCLCAAPPGDIKLQPFGLLMNRVSVVGSLIASPKELRDMLKFAGEHGVKAQVELLPMEEVNKGMEKIKNNDVKYRVVLYNKTTQ